MKRAETQRDVRTFLPFTFYEHTYEHLVCGPPTRGSPARIARPAASFLSYIYVLWQSRDNLGG